MYCTYEYTRFIQVLIRCLFLYGSIFVTQWQEVILAHKVSHLQAWGGASPPLQFWADSIEMESAPNQYPGAAFA